MTPQETHAAVVSLLQQQGLPLTTANLNRGMLALAQNDMSTEGAALPAVNASIDRTMGAAQQAASRPATAQQSLPTPPIPPTANTQQPPQQVAPTTLELSTPGSLPAGVRNSIEAFLTNGSTQQAQPTPVQQTTPDGSASSLVDAPRPQTLERSAPQNNLYDYEGSDQPVRIPGVTQTAAPTTPSTNASARAAATAPSPTTATAAPRGPIMNTVDQGVSAAQDYLSKLMADPASIAQSLPTPPTARVDARNAQLGSRNAQMQQLEQRAQDQSLPPTTQSKVAPPTAASTTTPVEARNAALGARNTQMQQLEQYAQNNVVPSPTSTPTPAAVGNADMRPSTPLYDMTTGSVELPGDSPLTPTASSMRSPTNLVDAMRQQSQQRIADQIAAMTGGNAILPGNTDAMRAEGMTIPALQQPMRDPRQFSTVSDQMSDPTIAALAPYRLPESPDAVDMASMVLGGPTGIAPNLKLFLQRRMLGAPSAMRSGQEALTYNAAPRIGYDGNTPAMVTASKSPPMLSPPSTMANPEGFGYEAALEARRLTGQRAPYLGEGSDHFIKGGNAPSASSSAPSSSVKTNTPTWKGESDPSAPMGARSTTAPTQSTPAQKQNTATPHTPSQDTSGAGSAIKQSLTKRKQMAASKSTRKSEK